MKAGAQDLTIRNLHDEPILMQQMSICRIQTGIIRIIHPINLTEIEITINQLTNIVHHKQKNNNAFIEISKHKIRELYSNFMQIKPTMYRRAKNGTSSVRRGNGLQGTQTPRTYELSTKASNNS